MNKLFKKYKNKKLLYFLSITIVGLILVIVARFTFAYFQPQVNSYIEDINATFDQPDKLEFSLGDPITMKVTSTTLSENRGNSIKESFATASLRANNSTNTATYNYYVYFEIISNNFIYSDGTTPELLLYIEDSAYVPYTGNIEGLTRKDVEDINGDVVSGYDITTATGLYKILSPTITSNSSVDFTDQTWNIKVIYVNLPDVDQGPNSGHILKSKLIVSKEDDLTSSTPVTLANYIKGKYNSANEGENNIYYHDGTGSYASYEAGDYSYRYSGGDYVLTTKATSAGYSTITSTSSSTTTNLINFYCSGTKYYVSYTCSASYTHYFTLSYDKNNTQYATYDDALNKAVEDGYLTSNNIKNYVCFGFDDQTGKYENNWCPIDNLYRIIGVFKKETRNPETGTITVSDDYEVKLIKASAATKDDLGDTTISADYYGSTATTTFYSGKRYTNPSEADLYYWHNDSYTTTYTATSKYNVWDYSKLNTLHLNGYYLSNISKSNNIKWNNKIADSVWYLYGQAYYSSYVKTIYNYELGTYKTTNTLYFYPNTYKVGVMYLSEYGYGMKPSRWSNTYESSYSTYKDENWMYSGLNEWTISRYSSYTYYAFFVNYLGNATYGYTYSAYNAIRPTFRLKSDVLYDGGSGTIEDPYRIF